MTRSPDATGTPGRPGWPPTDLVLTLRQDGPRRTLLDVVAAGSTSVVGQRDAVEAMLCRAEDELRPAIGGHGGLLVVLGGVEGATTDRLPVAGQPDGAAGVTARVGSCGEARALVAEARAGQAVVVLVGPDAAGSEPSGVVALVEAAARRQGVAVVVGGRCEACREEVVVDDAEPRADGGRPVTATATATIGMAVSGPVGEAIGRAAAVETAVAELDVLGPVTVRGAAAGLSGHPKLTELAVYLVLHEGGAPSRVWAEALWPERAVPPQTIANRLSELRRLLGFAPDGRPRLRRDGDRHQLADVRTDWGRVRVLAAPSAGPEQWREALALVRGRPFTGLRDAGWTQVEGHAAEVERVLTDCALRTSAALLAERRPDEAAWAAEQGLRAVPWDERLHRALMRAGAAAGDLGRVEETLRHLALALEIDGDPLGRVHPETARLYRELSARSSGAAPRQRAIGAG